MSKSVTSRSHGSTPPQGSNCDRPWSLHSCGVIKFLYGVTVSCFYGVAEISKC